MAEQLGSGQSRKMHTTLDAPVRYAMRLGDHEVAMNPLLGQRLSLVFNGEISCVNCARKIKKTFNQGYCYPCFQRLAQCDSCIVSPEKCHYDAGTCREPEWGETNCMIEHVVYLANTSGVKVGITRGTQVPTRWMDQGATQALPALRVDTRFQSGLAETVFKQHMADKTNWRTMLKGDGDPIDLLAARDALLEECSGELEQLGQRFGLTALQPVNSAETTNISYPVLEYPVKVSSFNLDKNPEVHGTLLGIKGQYLMFDGGVINIRKYGGYHLSLSREE